MGGRLFWKIFLGFWLTLLLHGAGAALIAVLYYKTPQRSEIMLDRPAQWLTSTAAVALEHGGARAVKRLIRSSGGPARVPLLVVDERGRDVLGRSVPAASLAAARKLLAGSRQAVGAHLVRGPDGREFLMFVPADNVPLLMRASEPPTIPNRITAIGLGVIASIGFSAVLAWYLSQPIRVLRTSFDNVAQGDLETRVSPAIGKRRDEIADLGRDFDRMADRLQQLLQSQQRLLHVVSHELRSPLARLQVAIGLARQSPEKTDSALLRIERESQRLDTLVGEVLTLSRLESGAPVQAEDYVDIVELLRTVIEDARFECGSSHEITLLGDTDEELVFQGSVELLHRAFENVVRNAIHHTPKQSQIEVLIAADAGAGVLSVSIADRGLGLPDDEIQTIFEPFKRSVQSHSGGYGLGLAIAKSAIRAHGGTIGAENRPGGGLIVRVSLPMRHWNAVLETESG
jgi:two-component system OmpR family sensor kinase